jgi:Spy/CpxP family protein refolding chaperone
MLGRPGNAAGPTGTATPGGGERRGGGGRGGSIAFLVRNEQIAKELGLTEDQVKKITAAVPEGMRDMSDEDRAKAVTKLEADVKAVMTADQNKRLREIRLQMGGTRALTQPDVAKELGLSEDQVKKIEAALDVPRPEGGGQTPGGERPSDEERAKMREEAMKAREAASAKALAVLTPEQKKKWDAMLGKKFELQRQQGTMQPPAKTGITSKA